MDVYSHICVHEHPPAVITRIEKECPEAIEIDTNNDSSEEIDINCKDIPLALLEKLNSYCRKKLK